MRAKASPARALTVTAPSTSAALPQFFESNRATSYQFGSHAMVRLKVRQRTVVARALSDDFHVAVELPLGDGLAELPLFPFARCRKMIDEGVAEQIARRLRSVQPAR